MFNAIPRARDRHPAKGEEVSDSRRPGIVPWQNYDASEALPLPCRPHSLRET